MEANPEPAIAVGEQFYRALIKAARQPGYTGAFTITISVGAGSSQDEITKQLDSAAAMFSGGVNYSKLGLNKAKNTASIEVELLEPAFTNRYAQHRPINDVKIRDWLSRSSYGRPIKPDSVYTCRIVIKTNRPEVFLAWDDGEELLYRFDGTTSHRYRFFEYLLAHSDMSHSLAA